jgi:hypothetical protein
MSVGVVSAGCCAVANQLNGFPSNQINKSLNAYGKDFRAMTLAVERAVVADEQDSKTVNSSCLAVHYC